MNAVKAVEMGDGFAAASGEANAHPIRSGSDGPVFLATVRAESRRDFDGAADPAQGRVQADQLDPDPDGDDHSRGRERGDRAKGRHDSSFGIHGAPVIEAMVALVPADQALPHHAQCG